MNGSSAGSSAFRILTTSLMSIAASSRICDSSRNVTVSWPHSARIDDAQPSYCFRSRVYFCQRADVSLNWVPARSKTWIFSSLSRSSSSSSSDSFSM